MATLNLDKDNVKELELKVEEIRNFLDGEDLEELEVALDEAQGDVYADRYNEYYLVIKVVS